MLKNLVIAILIAVIGIGSAVAAIAATRTVETTASVEVRVWRNVADPGRLHLSTRPAGGSWTTHEDRLDMSEFSRSGSWHQSNFVTVDVPISFEVEEAEPEPAASSVSGTGPSVEAVALPQGLLVCTFAVQGNTGTFGSATNVIVRLLAEASSSSFGDLLVNEIEEEGSWERVLRAAGGDYLAEVDVALGATWSLSCE